MKGNQEMSDEALLQYRRVAEELLRHHYLAQVKGTTLVEEAQSWIAIDDKIEPFEAINLVAQVYGLVRVEFTVLGDAAVDPFLPLTLKDQVKAILRLDLDDAIANVQITDILRLPIAI
nr:hypothetical protein [Pseudomonas luteola]